LVAISFIVLGDNADQSASPLHEPGNNRSITNMDYGYPGVVGPLQIWDGEIIRLCQLTENLHLEPKRLKVSSPFRKGYVETYSLQGIDVRSGNLILPQDFSPHSYHVRGSGVEAVVFTRTPSAQERVSHVVIVYRETRNAYDDIPELMLYSSHARDIAVTVHRQLFPEVDISRIVLAGWGEAGRLALIAGANQPGLLALLDWANRSGRFTTTAINPTPLPLFYKGQLANGLSRLLKREFSQARIVVVHSAGKPIDGRAKISGRTHSPVGHKIRTIAITFWNGLRFEHRLNLYRGAFQVWVPVAETNGDNLNMAAVAIWRRLRLDKGITAERLQFAEGLGKNKGRRRNPRLSKLSEASDAVFFLAIAVGVLDELWKIPGVISLLTGVLSRRLTNFGISAVSSRSGSNDSASELKTVQGHRDQRPLRAIFLKGVGTAGALGSASYVVAHDLDVGTRPVAAAATAACVGAACGIGAAIVPRLKDRYQNRQRSRRRQR
jgi:hypothetical protein